MTMRLTPYLNFLNDTAEAMTFYRSVFGGELSMTRFAEFGMTDEPDKIMHSQLVTEAGFTLMAADTPAYMQFRPGTNVNVAVFGEAEDEATLRSYWTALSEGAEIQNELAPAPWGDQYGALTDRFGTLWMINIAAVPSQG